MSGAMSRTVVSLCCAVVKEKGVHTEFVDQPEDDELRIYFQQDEATCHTSKAFLMTGLFRKPYGSQDLLI